MGDTQEVVYENTSTSNYNDLSNIVSRNNSEIIKNLMLSLGYFLFATISLDALQNTYKYPIIFIRNIIYIIAFFGISYTYMESVKISYFGDIDVKDRTLSVNKTILFNIGAILYGLLSIFNKDTKYHMGIFYNKMVTKPTFFGVELDGLIAFVGHILLLATYVLQNTGWYMMSLVSMLFVVSNIIAFSTNIKIDHVKYKWLYYSVLIGSLLIGFGYSIDIILTIQRILGNNTAL